MNETTQLVSRNETTQLCTAVDRLQPPTTAYNHLQPPATAYNRLQPPAPPLQQNRLFLPTVTIKGTYVLLQPIGDIMQNEAHDCQFNAYKVGIAKVASCLER
ncbi:hypothetical protein TNCV_3130091 [Trichonephila clavipes]|nr:hypothetical protein TNCV_3130091 [Trichonephila clavipes]